MLVLTTLLGALLAGLICPPTATAVTTSARALLLKLTARAEADSATYRRSSFRHWVDADRDSCDAREEVLIAESKVKADVGSRCTVRGGRWVSWYDGGIWTKPSDVDIDHVVPLKEAWESGASTWSAKSRERYANDLGHAWSLDAVTDDVNQAKGHRDPAQWLPPKTSIHCTYAIHWIAVKYRWDLAVDSAEKAMLASILSGRCGARNVRLPARAI
jgi:hypothetical protein